MKKKWILLLVIIVGIFILILCVKPDDSTEAAVMENVTVGTNAVSERQKEWIEEKKTESKKVEEAQAEQKVGKEPEKQEQIAVPEIIQI